MSQGNGYRHWLKVLFANHTGKVGGAEASLLTLLRALTSLHGNTIKIALAAPSDGHLLAYADAAGVHILPVNRLRRLKRPKDAIDAIKLALSLLRGTADASFTLHAFSPHIVHCNSLQATLYFALPTTLRRLPIIWHCRDVLMPRSAARIAGICSSAIIAISNAVSNALIELGIPREKIHVIYNAVDVTSLEQADHSAVSRFREMCGVPEDGLLIGMVAHIVPWKRHDIFIHMAGIMARERKHAQFVIVGGDMFGEHKDWIGELMELRDKLALKDRLLFAGVRDDIATVMNAIDILVHPTPTEPFGRAIVEAMAVGKAVIAINAFGPAELISDGINGLLVDSPTPEALAQAAIRLIDDPQLRKSIGSAARMFVAERLSPPHHADAILKLWQKVLSKRRAQRKQLKMPSTGL